MVVIAVGVFATTLSQVDVLAALPLRNLLKNSLHASRAANAAFFFWAGLAWYFKPLAGIITDAFPLFGSRRRSYILVCSTIAVLIWIGLIFTPHAYAPLLWVCIAINIFLVVTSTAIGGYMVEVAHANAGSGRLTALRQFVSNACVVINGPLSGYMASIAFGWTAAACGGVLFLIVPVTILCLREQFVEVDSDALLTGAGNQLKTIASARAMWAATALMALFYVAPGFGTALFYRQQDELHMTTQMQGFLALLGGLGGILAAICYSRVCRRFNLQTLLMGCLFVNAATGLGYLFYSSVLRAEVIDSVNGFTGTLAELALMDLAVRATPKGSEGVGFSLMMAVRNLAVFGSDWLGSAALDRYHLLFGTLVVANSLTTFITVPLVLALPRILVRHKDAEVPVEPAMPKSMPQM